MDRKTGTSKDRELDVYFEENETKDIFLSMTAYDTDEWHLGIHTSANRITNESQNFTIIAITTCICTEWVNAECVSNTERRQIRVCEPGGCDVEERIIPDFSCQLPPEEIKLPWWSFILTGIPAIVIKTFK